MNLANRPAEPEVLARLARNAPICGGGVNFPHVGRLQRRLGDMPEIPLRQSRQTERR